MIWTSKMSKNGFGNWLWLTFVAKCPIIGCAGAIAGVPVVFLYAFASILTVRPVAGAVARAPGFEPGCDLCSFFQVQCHPVHPQGADAAQKALLASGTTWEDRRHGAQREPPLLWLLFHSSSLGPLWSEMRLPRAGGVLAVKLVLPNRRVCSFFPVGYNAWLKETVFCEAIHLL